MEEEILLLKTAVVEENRENGRETTKAFTLPVENRNGFAFGILEAHSRSLFAQNVMEIVHDRFSRLAATLEDTGSIPRRFEQTLEAINEEIAERASEMETFPAEDINAVVGLAVDKTMYISGTGELAAIFLHKLPEGRYQVFNLARNIKTEQAIPNWQKLFVVVLDGDLKPGDLLCVCNFDLQQEMPPEELHSLLAVLPPQSAVVKLRQYFPLEVNLSLFILKVGSSDEERPQISAPASIKQLQASREQTKRVLADQKPTFVKTLVYGFLTLFKDQRVIKHLFKNLFKLFFSSVTVIFFMLRDLIRWFFRTIKRLVSSERKEVFTEARSHFENSTYFVRSKLGRLPKTSKYLILAAVAIVIIIVVGIFIVSRGRQASAERAAFETSITRIESLNSAAESALIYKDENKAKSLIKEAQTALNSIVTDNQENITRINEVKKEIEKTANGLRRVTEIENPEVLASTANIENPPVLSAMTETNNNIYLFGNNKTVYILNSTDKKLDYAAGTEFSTATAASTDGSFALWLDDKSVINIFDTSTDGQMKAAANAPTGEKWLDLYAYADRLYVLSPNTGLSSQVYRMDRSGLNLSSPTAWIKSPITELTDGVSLAVDGTVFVLRANGKILRFVGGRDVAWNQGAVEPEITSGKKIWTSADSSYLYTLDPAGQRLVVYEKESGNLVVQYHSTSFTNLVDFVVDEANKNIYLLGDGKVYKVEAGHLK